MLFSLLIFIGKMGKTSFNKVYVLSLLHEYIYFIRMGSFYAEPPPPKQRVERQRKAPSKEAKRIMPTQVGKHKLGQLHSVTCTYTLVLLWGLSESWEYSFRYLPRCAHIMLSAEENGWLPSRSHREGGGADPRLLEELLPRWSYV